MSHKEHFIPIRGQLMVFAVLTTLGSLALAQPPNFAGPPGLQPTDVNVVNKVEVEGNVRVEPRTRSYTLRINTTASSNTPGIPITNTEHEIVPFDSFIVGVTFSARMINSKSCRAELQYPSIDVRPGGANTNIIALAYFPTGSPTFSEASDFIHDSKHVPVPNMFIGRGVDLELVTRANQPISIIGTGITSLGSECNAQALVHLIPASANIGGPGDIGF